MVTIRHLSRNTLIYAVGIFLQRGIVLFMVPLYTSVLLVAEYGALEALTVTQQTLRIVVNFGMAVALMRFYTECEQEDDVAEMFRTSFVVVIGLSLGAFLLFSPFIGAFGQSFLKYAGANGWIILTFLWAIGGALSDQVFVYYRARQDAKGYVIVSAGISLLTVLLTILLVRVFKWGITGILVSNIVALMLVNVWLMLKFWARGRSLSGEWAVKLLRFGGPLIFVSLGWLILNSADRYFLAYYHDLEEVGLYSLGYKVGLIVQIAVVAPFQLAWAPFVFSKVTSNDEGVKRDFSTVLTYLMLAFGFSGAAMLLFAPEVIAILGSGSYTESIQVVPFVVVAYAFNGIYYWAASLFHYLKKSFLLSVIIISMALLNLILNWVLVPDWGWKGAAIATIVSVGGAGLLVLIIGLYLYPISLQWTRLAKIGASIAIVMGLYELLSSLLSIEGIIERLVSLIALPVVLLIFRFFEPREIKFATSLFVSFRQKLFDDQDTQTKTLK